MSGPLWPHRWPEAPFDVVGLGQCSLDHVIEVDVFPRITTKQRVERYGRHSGGQVATALLCCARLGWRCAYLGSVGDDAAGSEALAPLEEAGIDCHGVRRAADTPSQLAFILVDRESGERTVLWHRDPRLSLEVGGLSESEIQRGRVLHLDAGDPELGLWAARRARERGQAVVLDADTPDPGLEPLLGAVDFPIVSQQFAEELYGSAERAVEQLEALGARMPVVTLGEQGALGSFEGRPHASPAFRVPVRDTTGAGDVFHAAFVHGLLEGLGAESILRVANAAAAMNCRALGAQGGLPTRDGLEAFLRSGPATLSSSR